jgi:hypothetical protein
MNSTLHTYTVTLASTRPLWTGQNGTERPRRTYTFETYKEPDVARDYIKRIECSGGEWQVVDFQEEEL